MSGFWKRWKRILTFHADSLIEGRIRFRYQLVVLRSNAVANASAEIYHERCAVYAFAPETEGNFADFFLSLCSWLFAYLSKQGFVIPFEFTALYRTV